MMKIFYSFLLLFAFGYADVSNSKDRLGREVATPPSLERIAITCYGGAVHEIVLFLGEDNIVAHPGAQRFKFFEKLYPKLTTIKSVGTFNDVNLETLLKVKPDIVFAGITASQTNERIEAMGIPVFTLGTGKHTLETLLEEFTQVGTLVGKQDKAKDLVTYWNETLTSIEQALSKNQKKLKVFYANGSNQISSESKGWWGDVFITKAGGINVAQDMTIKGTISAEKVLELNPDVLILSKNLSYQTSVDDIKKNPLYKNLSAVKNNQVYVAPVGGFWWDRPSPEAILGILWLSKILYPHEMKSIDLKEESKFFYEKFYNYKLTDSEYESFFKETEGTK